MMDCSSFPLPDLPDIWHNIFMLLDPKDFARASCACKTLKSLCYNDVSFWAHAIHPGARNAIVSLNQIGANVVSPDTEIKALRCCMSLAALALGNFQTTLEEDKRILLKECSPSVNAQATKTKQQVLAIRFRVEKKKILSGAMARLNEAIAREQK